MNSVVYLAEALARLNKIPGVESADAEVRPGPEGTFFVDISVFLAGGKRAKVRVAYTAEDAFRCRTSAVADEMFRVRCERAVSEITGLIADRPNVVG